MGVVNVTPDSFSDGGKFLARDAAVAQAERLVREGADIIEGANLPIVDTQRVQDVQRTLATGAFRIEPAQVADRLLTFEAGLGPA